MKIHFIGIGGTGISGLAQYYLSKGSLVSGSDLAASSITELLEGKGAEVSVGANKVENIRDCDLVVYSPAVKDDNPELLEAKRRGIRCLTYPQALGELTKDHFTIAVSGTHGKSTTTSMIALILVEAGFDPTVVVGTKLKEFGDSNFRLGGSEYLVIEACEYEDSFLNYWPKIEVVTNIEEDHLDYFGTLENIKKSFKEFVSHLGEGGILVKRKDVEISAGSTVEFSLDDKEDIEKIKTVIKIPGEHNLLDALAAVKVARLLGIDDGVSLSALSKYRGAWRRFEETLFPDFILIDDYAHHPTEIIATLRGTREKYPDKKIYCIFQPHQYQRTYLLFDDFVGAFKEAIGDRLVDKLFLVDIYDVVGRESLEAKSKVSSPKLAEAIGEGAVYVPKDKLFDSLAGGEIIIFMGAGNIYDLSEDFKKKNGICS
jgi:UDP-N-acetylmuramate--alanine ligase